MLPHSCTLSVTSDQLFKFVSCKALSHFLLCIFQYSNALPALCLTAYCLTTNTSRQPYSILTNILIRISGSYNKEFSTMLLLCPYYFNHSDLNLSVFIFDMIPYQFMVLSGLNKQTYLFGLMILYK